MRFSEIINEISRRDFLKGAGATTFSAILPNITNATTRETAISNIASIAGTIHDMQKLGWSRSQIIKDFERRNTGPDLMKVVTIVASMAFVYPKGYLTRAEFVRMVEQQARQNLPDDPEQVARKKAEADKIDRSYRDRLKRDQEEMRKEKEIADEKQRIEQEKIDNFNKDLTEFASRSSELITQRFNYLIQNKMKRIESIPDTKVQVQITANGSLAKFGIYPNQHNDQIFSFLGLSSYDQQKNGKAAWELFKNPKLYLDLFPEVPADVFQQASENNIMIMDIEFSGENWSIQNGFSNTINVVINFTKLTNPKLLSNYKFQIKPQTVTK
jgi:hypothetical protein